MATHTIATATAGTGGSGLLPRNISNNIWKKATARSIIPSLATSTPIIIGENSFPTLTKRPAASIVGEGQNKPDSSIEVGAKTVRPIKAVVGLEFTLEAILTNPGGILGLMEEELSAALARQVDLAVLHGRQASDGQPLTSGVEYLNQTTNRVELTNPEATDAELWAGYGLVVNGGNNFTGFAADPRLVYNLAIARHPQSGQRLNPDINMSANMNEGALSSYAGQRLAVSQVVSGQVDASADTKVRAFGGDWDALRFGYAWQLRTKKIEYGDPFGNGDLQRRNAVAYMTEAVFGWAILDQAAFVAYEDAA